MKLEKNANLLIEEVESNQGRKILSQDIEKSIKDSKNLLIVDSGEDYYHRYLEQLKENKYQVLVINLNHALSSDGWNPLTYPYYLHKHDNMDKALELVNAIGKEIFKSDNPNTDPFWENTSADYFTGLVLTLFENAKEEEINFGSISLMITNGEEKINDSSLMKKYLETLDPLSPAYLLLSGTACAPNETRSSIISVFRLKMNAFLLRPNLSNLLCTNQVKLENLKDKTAIFIISYKPVNAIVNTFIQELMMLIKLNQLSFNFTLDDFDTLPILEMIDEMLKDAIRNDYRISIKTNNIEALKEKYGKYSFDYIQDTFTLTKSTEKESLKVVLKELPNLELMNHYYFDFAGFVERKLKVNK